MAERLLDDQINLHIHNLHMSIDNARLEREFSRFGRIVSARVMTNAGRSKGYGFVCFASSADANTAIREMNGRLLEGRRLYVSIAHRQRPPLEMGQFFPAGPIRGYYNPYLPQRFYRPPPLSVFKLPRWAPPPASLVYQPARSVSSQRPAPPPPLRHAPPPPPSMFRQFADFPNLSNPNEGQRMFLRGPIYNSVDNLPVSETPQPGPSQPSNTYLRPIPEKKYPPPHLLLTKEMLDAVPPYKRKPMIKEQLFPIIQSMYPHLATKVIAVLLQLTNGELLHLLHDKESLQRKVAEIANCYRDHCLPEPAASATKKE